jgi:hypothetical protein
MLKAVSSITNAIGALNYKGTWNASTNTPTLVSGVGVKGDYYVVSVAGSTALDSISNWGVGDWVTFNGSAWQRVEGGADGNFVNLSVSGDAGIGTSAPAVKLDVLGAIRASTGILFGSDTAAANTLDDYEVGTFTPTITVQTPGDFNVTYNTRTGHYQKVGDRVTIHIIITTSAFTHTTASGAVTITGLPFNSSSSVGSTGPGGEWANITKANYTQLGFLLNTASPILIPRLSGSGQAVVSLTIADMPSGGTVRLLFSMTYISA